LPTDKGIPACWYAAGKGENNIVFVSMLVWWVLYLMYCVCQVGN